MFFTVFKWKAAQRFYEIRIRKHVCIFMISLWQEQRGGMRGGGQEWEGAEGWIIIVVVIDVTAKNLMMAVTVKRKNTHI